MSLHGAHLRGALLVAAGSAIAPSAHAGAWSLPQGAQQWFATISREEGDFGEAWRAEDFTEFGLGDDWALTAKVESEIRIDNTYDDRSGFRFGVQKAFALGERASFALQASVLAGESLDGPECVGEGFEARAALGTSFSWDGREGYVNIEAGQRSRGGCDRSVVEFATGLEFAPGWNLGLKSWQDGSGQSASAKAELTMSYDFGFIGVGVGWREEISGNFEEKGWVLAARTRF